MTKTGIAPAALADAATRTLVQDRFGDRAVRLEDGNWLYPETAPLTSEYIAKHYAPFALVVLGLGDTFSWPEEAMSVPVGTVVETPLKCRYRKVGNDAWAHIKAEEQVISTRELTSGQMLLTIVA